MLNYFKKLFAEYDEILKEINQMGLTTSPWGTHFNKDMFEAYIEKMEKVDQSSSKG
jgi:hypothetical protein